MNHIDLSSRAMLVALHISVWSARKMDESVTLDVARRHNASRKSGNYQKLLVPDECPEYDAVRAAEEELRAFHCRMTLPWAEDSVRILKATSYMDYSTGLSDRKDAFHRAARNFIKSYPEVKQRAKQDRKGLYNEADYPVHIENRFGIRHTFLPLPTDNDFRVKLDMEELERLRDSYREELQWQISESMRDPYRRLHKVVSRMAERLSNPEAKFKDSLVENIQEMLEVLPAINLTDDPELERLQQEVKDKLTKHNPEVLRHNQGVRRKTAMEAEELAKRLAGIFGGEARAA